MQYFDDPVGRVKIQTTSKNIQRYYTPKRLIRDLLSNDLFSQNSDLPRIIIFVNRHTVVISSSCVKSVFVRYDQKQNIGKTKIKKSYI